jgi:hypothetical protein
VRLAIIGATGEIAGEFVLSFAKCSNDTLTSFVRCPQVVAHCLRDHCIGAHYVVTDGQTFSVKEDSYAEVNFFGAGNPATSAAMGEIEHHQNFRGIFLNGGASYGSILGAPVCN